MDQVQRLLLDHIENDRVMNERMHEKLAIIEKQATNHLAHIQPDLAAVRTDVDWLKKIVLGVFMASVSSLLGVIYQILIQR